MAESGRLWLCDHANFKLKSEYFGLFLKDPNLIKKTWMKTDYFKQLYENTSIIKDTILPKIRGAKKLVTDKNIPIYLLSPFVQSMLFNKLETPNPCVNNSLKNFYGDVLLVGGDEEEV